VSAQLTLWRYVPVTTRGLTIQQQFDLFHAANPWVYTALVQCARDLVGRGHRRLGIGMLAEVVRWQYFRQTTDASGFKLNNNYRSRYVRLIVEREPDLADLFETRELRTP
jgi:hypothetical protein